jgi:ribonuclease BN (tRNA processing enzyme)
LLQAPGSAVWVDAGSGTMAEVQRHVGLDELDAIWISHLHPDHCSDLLAAYSWHANASQPRRVPVFGPPGWAGRFDPAVAADGAGKFGEIFEVQELSDGLQVVINGIRLTARAVAHTVPAFGLRAERGGRVIAYSADSGPCEALASLARDADVVVCEAGVIAPGAGHLTPEQAADLAVRSGARRLVLTHLAPGLEPADAAVRARLADPVIARVGQTHA